MIVKTKYAKDFGWGFYTTQDEEQAKRWAKRRAQRFDGTPSVSVYEYTSNETLLSLEFKATSPEWIDFIAACRHGNLHRYDVVSGPMADDDVWNVVEDYLSGIMSREEFLSTIKFRHPTHQMSFHSIAGLNSISFVRGYEV